MTDLFREAEEELRKDTMETVARKAAPWVIGALVVALAGGTGWQLWQGHQQRQNAAAADAYDGAMLKLQGGDLDAGAAALEEVARGGGGFAALAGLQRAAVLQEKGDAAGARAAFESAARSFQDRDLADLATLRAAWIASETETRAQLQARLKPVVDRAGPFSLLARELLAAAAWHEGDGAAAKAEYELLQLDPRSPEGLRNRAQQAIAVIDAGATASRNVLALPGEQGRGAGAGAGAAGGGAAGPGVAGAPGTTPAGQPRIIRLPPGQRLPPGFVAPPGVQIIETPLPAGARPPGGAGQVPAELLAEIEAARAVGTERQREVTQAQQAASEPASPTAAAAPATPGQSRIEQGIEAIRETAPAAPAAAQAPTDVPAGPAAPAPSAPAEPPKEGN